MESKIPLYIREQIFPNITGKSPLHSREDSLAANAFLTVYFKTANNSIGNNIDDIPRISKIVTLTNIFVSMALLRVIKV